MAKTPEGIIKNGVLCFLRGVSGGVFWNSPSAGVFDPTKGRFRKTAGRKGVADILGCFKGHFIAIEVKTKKGKLTDHQISFLKDVAKSGGYACVVRSVEDAIEFIELIEKEESCGVGILVAGSEILSDTIP